MKRNFLVACHTSAYKYPVFVQMMPRFLYLLNRCSIGLPKMNSNCVLILAAAAVAALGRVERTRKLHAHAMISLFLSAVRPDANVNKCFRLLRGCTNFSITL